MYLFFNNFKHICILGCSALGLYVVDGDIKKVAAKMIFVLVGYILGLLA